MRSTWIVVGLALAGCGKKDNASNTGSASGSAPAGSGSAAVGSAEGSGSAAPVAAGCDLAGGYRLRFTSNGKEGWWFRFTVTGDKATLDEGAEVLALEPGPLELKTDAAKCSLVLGAKSSAVGDATLTLAVDPKTHAVTGTLARTKAVDEKEKSTTVTGVHDGAAVKGRACVAAGIYKVSFDPKVVWKNKESGDKRDCKDRWIDTIVKVEPYGDSVAISNRDYEPPYGERWGSDKLAKIDECSANLEISGEGYDMIAKVTFAGDKITAVASAASVQVVEDGDDGENLWDCVAKDAPVVFTRVDKK